MVDIQKNNPAQGLDAVQLSHLVEVDVVEHLEHVCMDCGGELLHGHLVMHEDEKLSRLKNILDSQETGVDISYRCVRCRDCLDCKNAEKVDKISLREEAEDYEIRNSVELNWEKKMIFVSLPLRGKERDFLSSNQDRALKVRIPM